MPTPKLQASFSGGEYSPNIYARTDIAKYNSGLRTCRNFIVHPHGGASNRSGFELIATQGKTATRARTVDYIFSDSQAYTLEFGDEYIRFFTDGAGILVAGADAYSAGTAYTVNDFVTYSGDQYLCIQDGTGKTPDTETDYWTEQDEYEIYSPYAEADIRDLKFESSADVIYITHNDYQTRTLTRYGSTDWRLELFAPTDGPFMPSNIDETLTMTLSAVTGTAVSATVSSAYFVDDNVGSLFQFKHYIEGQSLTSAVTTTAATSSISCFTTWRLISHGTWTGTVAIEKSTDAGSTWTKLRTFSSANDFNMNTFGTEDIELNETPFLLRIKAPSFTSGTCNIDLSSDPYYQNGIGKVTAVPSSTVATVNMLVAAGSTAATYLWSEGSWSTRRGFPSDSAFIQDRLVMASSIDEPMTTWASKIGSYKSYGRNQLTTLDTDSLSVNLLTRQLNAINGLVAMNELMAFTSSSEWRMSGSNDGIITPSTFSANVQGYRGSNGLKPIVIGNQILYVQSKGKVVRNLGYELSSDSFAGVDLRILAEHLFKGYTIVDMAYQQDDDSIVWLVRSDGVLLSATYMYEQEVIAWARHDTNGVVESCCVVPGEEYDELWITVARNGSRFIERMVNRLTSTDPQDQIFMDSSLSSDVKLTITGITQASPAVVTSTSHGLADGDFVDLSDIVGMTELNDRRFLVANKTDHTFELTEEDSGDDIDSSAYTAYSSAGYARKAFTSFTGLDHLEGMDVAILGNGEVFPQQTVTSGAITLTRACSRVHVGLPYFSDLETLNIENTGGGTIQGKKVKIGRVTFRVLNTRGGWVGPNSDTLYEDFIPVRTRLGLAPELFSGDIPVLLGAGYEDGGRVFYRQIDPLPVTITAIIPEMTVGG